MSTPEENIKTILADWNRNEAMEMLASNSARNTGSRRSS